MLQALIEPYVEDPRGHRAKRYSLYEILCLALLAILAGETTYTGMEEYGRLHKKDLARCFGIQGIPSHDTIRLLFERLIPEQFLNLFEGLWEKVARAVILLDGKTIRNSESKPFAYCKVHPMV